MDIPGKVTIITGASAGIGLITVYPWLTATDFGKNSLGDPQARARQRQHTTTGPNLADTAEFVAARILAAAQNESAQQFMDAYSRRFHEATTAVRI